MITESPKRIRVRQVRSVAGRSERTLKTIAALGLGRVGKVREFNATRPLLGMVKKVEHIVQIEVVS